MNWRSEWKWLVAIPGLFLLFYYLPLDSSRVRDALLEGFHLAQWYAREHVILCLVPAFFIAGAIAVFISQAAVMRYLGAQANKVLSYGVASVSGTVLAVCSCTVLPLFAGIYRMGAGLGPAIAFLYAGPAINVLAIILTARVLGLELGIARAAGAVVFSIVIGLVMHLIFRSEETERVEAHAQTQTPDVTRPLYQNVLYFAAMIAILVFATWSRPDQDRGLWLFIFDHKWQMTGFMAVGLGVMLFAWFRLPWIAVAGVASITTLFAVLFPQQPLVPFSVAIIGLSVITAPRSDETGEWFSQTWGFTKQILPLLFGGVLIAGFLLGRPGAEALIPARWISTWVGGNSITANLLASVVGAFMYFATLTEVPILQGLIGNGMGKGPALALLLAGPALSLPNMLVIRSVMGTKKTIVFILLVVVMATVSGIIYGSLP